MSWLKNVVSTCQRHSSKKTCNQKNSDLVTMWRCKYSEVRFCDANNFSHIVSNDALSSADKSWNVCKTLPVNRSCNLAIHCIKGISIDFIESQNLSRSTWSDLIYWEHMEWSWYTGRLGIYFLSLGVGCTTSESLVYMTQFGTSESLYLFLFSPVPALSQNPSVSTSSYAHTCELYFLFRLPYFSFSSHIPFICPMHLRLFVPLSIQFD